VSELPIRTVDLAKRFGEFVVTDRVSLSVEAHELHALIGPNGAGKTTLLSQLAGDLAPDAGEVFFFGEAITGLSTAARVRKGVVRSFQITSLFQDLSAIENLIVAFEASSSRSFKFWSDPRKDAPVRERAMNLLSSLHLAGAADAIVSDLNYGQQRQLEIAMALAVNPRVLLLDEPMAGLSRKETDDVVALIRTLKSRYTILLVEHDMHAVFALADRISVLVNGRIVAVGSPAAIRGDEDVRRAYLGESAARVGQGHARVD
jgi:branched-chain amino acid transport system ATP-binding protein